MIEEMNQILEGIDIRFQEPLKYYTYTKVGECWVFSLSS